MPTRRQEVPREFHPRDFDAAEGAARRDVPDLERAYPEMDMFGVLPAYALYAHHVDDLSLNRADATARM